MVKGLVVGGVGNIRGIYIRLLSNSRVATECACAMCDGQRKARGETPLGVSCPSVSVAARMAELANSGINVVLASLPQEVLHGPPDASGERLLAPLTSLVDEAHRQGIQVYPVCGALGGKLPIPKAEWGMVNADGVRVEYADPGNPEVREFFINSAVRLVKSSGIDGISLDFTRYAEIEHTGDCCYCEGCRARFMKQHGFDPIEVRVDGMVGGVREQSLAAGQHVWNQARRSNVTTYVRDLKAAIRSERKDIGLSAYVWGYASRLVFQDWPAWIAEGSLDWINPSGYTYDMGAFRRRCADVVAMGADRIPFAITLGPHTSHGRLKNVEELLRQLEIARSLGSRHYVLFTHSPAELSGWLPRLCAECPG